VLGQVGRRSARRRSRWLRTGRHRVQGSHLIP
jgi:hypothetical protein